MFRNVGKCQGGKMPINNSSTFINNMSLPVHRWFRYTAGFSAQWVMDEVKKYINEKRIENIKVLDPFAGSGTTLLSCDELGVTSYGFESHPFISKVAQAKLSWNTDINSVNRLAEQVLEITKILGCQTSSCRFPKPYG